MQLSSDEINSYRIPERAVAAFLAPPEVYKQHLLLTATGWPASLNLKHPTVGHGSILAKLFKRSNQSTKQKLRVLGARHDLAASGASAAWTAVAAASASTLSMCSLVCACFNYNFESTDFQV
jgi:hypothetical protein